MKVLGWSFSVDFNETANPLPGSHRIFILRGLALHVGLIAALLMSCYSFNFRQWQQRGRLPKSNPKHPASMRP